MVQGRVLTVMNMKGGVGKTTISACLGVLFSHPPNTKKVLLIDLDPQSNLSQLFLELSIYKEILENKKTLLSVLQESLDKINPFQIQHPSLFQIPSCEDVCRHVAPSAEHRLDLLPATLEMMYLAIHPNHPMRLQNTEQRFRAFLEKCKETYDLIILDCHPAGSLFTRLALLNADSLLVPVVPNAFALRGTELMYRFVKEVQAPLLEKTMILFNRSSPSEPSKEEGEIRGNARLQKKCLDHSLPSLSFLEQISPLHSFIESVLQDGDLSRVAANLLNRIEHNR